MTSGSQLNPADLDGLGGNMWDHARREYLSGVTAATVCQRYGVSLSSFRLHARVGGWRRMDQPASEIPPEPGEYHPDDDVSFADLAEEAFVNIRRALGAGRASEASTWMRVYDKLADRARAGVMSALPDSAPPVTLRDPLRLASAQEQTCDDSNALAGTAGAASQGLDTLHPPFSESNPAPSDP